MVQRMFSEMPEVMPARAYPVLAVQGLMQRMFARPAVLVGDTEPYTLNGRQAPRKFHKPHVFSPKVPLLQLGGGATPPAAAE